MKNQEIKDKLKEKLGEKMFTRSTIIAEQKFGNKESLKLKFYKSILEGYLNPSELWIQDENIETLKSKIDSANEEEKKEIILGILDTYDLTDPNMVNLIKKYKRYINPLKN
jgi:lipoate-protein ligase A